MLSPIAFRFRLVARALCGLVLLVGLTAAHPPPQSLSPAPTDTAVGTAAAADSILEARLRQIFSQIEDFQRITVAVQSGVVQLGGTVLQPQDAVRAEELARQVEEVLYVVDNMRAETDVETRVAPALEKIRSYADSAVANLPLLAIAVLVVLLFWLASQQIGRWEAPARRLRLSPLVWHLIRRVLQGVVAFVGLLLAFDLLGVTSLVGAVLGTAGVAGLAVGFAFQDIIENYLAGALLSIQQPFNVNDVVEVGGQQGRVVRLTARELVLLTFEGNHVRLPNARVFKSVTVNYTRNPRRLFQFDVGVGVQEDLVEATRLGIETLDAMNGVMADPAPFARIEALGDFSVIVRFHGWVNQRDADFFKVQSEAIRLVKTAFDEAGIDMPEPTRRILTRRMEAPEAPKKPVDDASAAQQAATIDVAPDGELEAQVEEDLAQSDEPNLLASQDAS
jgi:small-conductance mechanosensitive channel